MRCKPGMACYLERMSINPRSAGKSSGLYFAAAAANGQASNQKSWIDALDCSTTISTKVRASRKVCGYGCGQYATLSIRRHWIALSSELDIGSRTLTHSMPHITFT